MSRFVCTWFFVFIMQMMFTVDRYFIAFSTHIYYIRFTLSLWIENTKLKKRRLAAVLESTQRLQFSKKKQIKLCARVCEWDRLIWFVFNCSHPCKQIDIWDLTINWNGHLGFDSEKCIFTFITSLSVCNNNFHFLNKCSVFFVLFRNIF